MPHPTSITGPAAAPCSAYQDTGTRPPQSYRRHARSSPDRADGTPCRTTPSAVLSAVPRRAAGHATVTRRPPDPDRNRSNTRTSPTTANGAVPSSVSQPTDAPNSPTVRAASASASASVDQPDNWS
ncbi:hypothetical protein [Streptomyces sp. RerS4]|uniref:hypothetical protein n=1 Tax=Streptomyces sp. RerS4 TaxID=2942449 RepID=UPI00201BA008|nr:hypothetical protein [Streptomyces sp. RerS4]UQW99168.1 hypothetical protein M4D82_00395 [Streptomyces sp. RerS4]